LFNSRTTWLHQTRQYPRRNGCLAWTSGNT